MVIIKIVIEGGDIELMPTMKNYLGSIRPVVYVAFHAPLIGEDKRLQALNQIGEIKGIYRNCYDEAQEIVNM